MKEMGSPKLRIVIIHPDLEIGGAERLIVDAAVLELALGIMFMSSLCMTKADALGKLLLALNARGIRPAVLYPAINVEQFEGPCTYRKKNIGLAISAFAMLHAVEGDIFQGQNLTEVTLTVAGGFDKRLKENVEYLQELQSLAERE